MPGSEVAQIAECETIQPELSSPTPPIGIQPNGISKVLGLFDQHKERTIDRYRRWIEVRLQPEEYKDLQQTLAKDKNLLAYIHDNIQ